MRCGGGLDLTPSRSAGPPSPRGRGQGVTLDRRWGHRRYSSRARRCCGARGDEDQKRKDGECSRRQDVPISARNALLSDSHRRRRQGPARVTRSGAFLLCGELLPKPICGRQVKRLHPGFVRGIDVNSFRRKEQVNHAVIERLQCVVERGVPICVAFVDIAAALQQFPQRREFSPRRRGWDRGLRRPRRLEGSPRK
jgi:hypothetical protein